MKRIRAYITTKALPFYCESLVWDYYKIRRQHGLTEAEVRTTKLAGETAGALASSYAFRGEEVKRLTDGEYRIYDAYTYVHV